MEPVSSSLAILVWALGAKVGRDFATNIENRVFDAIINTVVNRQRPELEYMQRGLRDLLLGQQKIRADQLKQIEMFYKNGMDFLNDAKIAVKKKQKKQKLQEAIEAFTSAKNVEEGTNAAKAALLVGACYHLLYCIDREYGTANEERWYDEAFHLAEQSRGSDGKPSRVLIQELLGLPYLSGKYGTFEVYWQKWEPPPKLLPPPRSFQSPLIGVTNRPAVSQGYPGYPSELQLGTRRQTCYYCKKVYNVPFEPSKRMWTCPGCKRVQFLRPSI